MERSNETTRFLHEVGYPDNLFKRWGISLNDGNRRQATQDLAKILQQLPPLEYSILKFRYQKFLTIKQIAIELGIPSHTIRKRKEDLLRKIRDTKAGINLYRTYHKHDEGVK